MDSIVTLRGQLVTTADKIIKDLEEKKQQTAYRKNAFWVLYSRLHLKNNLLSVPLLVISSAAGVLSAVQISSERNLNWIVTLLAVSTSVLTALQKYFKFAERTENAKMTAKAWGRISRKINDMVTMVKSKATFIHDAGFMKFIEGISAEIEETYQNADELPDVLLENIASHIGGCYTMDTLATPPDSSSDDEPDVEAPPPPIAESSGCGPTLAVPPPPPSPPPPPRRAEFYKTTETLKPARKYAPKTPKSSTKRNT